MRRLVILLFFVLLFAGLKAQPYGNEWINYSQTYYKVPLTGEGIYRLSYAALVNGNFPIHTLSPFNLQLFIKGREWPIYIHNPGPDTLNFNSTDYIEFYAPPSDGWLDSLAFEDPTLMGNPYYSLYNDTLFAFLTYNLTSGNPRASYETDVNFAAYSSSQSQWNITEVVWHNPQVYYPGYSDPQYGHAEGWFDTDFQLGGSVQYSLATPGYAGSVYPVSFTYSVAGASNASLQMNINHHLRVSVDGTVASDTLFTGYLTIKKTLPWAGALSASTLVKAESVNDMGLSADRMAVGYFSIRYPRNYQFANLTGARFTVPSAGGTKTLLNFSGTPSTDLVLWDITNGRKILCQTNGSYVSALLPDQNQPRSCYLSTVTNIKPAIIKGKLQPVNYEQTLTGRSYYIITHSSLTTQAQAYKTYRDNTGFPAGLIDIEQLYLQYGYGVYKHPLAIRNFIRQALNVYSTPPEYIFLLGKSIHAGRVSGSECFRKDAVNYARCLVPSWGSPSSDHMLIAGLNIPGYQLPVSIGRLAARNGFDVMTYLNKVSEHEQQPPAMWMKNILHFSGGQTLWEQSLFASYMSSFANVITDTVFGGQVHTFYKTSSSPVIITLSDSIRNLINGGCSMMNFFGHGSSTGFDQNIQDPSYYDNLGKYPLVISNSCLTGDIHLPPELRLSEEWVFGYPQRGAIAFLASVDLGYADRLFAFTSEFIRQFTYQSYGQPLGKQIQMAVNQTQITYTQNDGVINTTLDFTLHGDPAVVLNSPPQPDLLVDHTSISYTPSPVTTELDSFNVRVIVYNQGMGISDDFVVELIRTYPGGDTTMHFKTMSGCVNRDTVIFRLPSDFINGPGLNRFCVRVDSEGWIAESSETNNSVCSETIIQSGDLIPVYPYEYAIYPDDSVTLKASSAYAFTSSQLCVFEIDTTDLFNSPEKRWSQFAYPGGVAEWTPPIALQDCTVYYWRVSLVPQAGGSYNWKESSFIYIPGKTGWSQAHYFQFKKDAYRFITYNRPDRKWDFVTSPHLLQCHTMGVSAITSYFDYKYSIDGIMDYGSCGAVNAMLVAVIDPQTLVPWTSGRSTGTYGNGNDPKCPSRTREDYYFIYYADSAYLSNLNLFIRNHIPDGHYILAYTFRNGMFKTWSEDLLQAFESLGADSIRSLENDWPYIFFCKKGDPSTAVQKIGHGPAYAIDLEHEIESDASYGYMTSTLIGPSASWGSLHWRYLADIVTETAEVEVTGITASDDRQVVFPSLGNDSLDVYNLEQFVQAATHPYMEMKLFARDDSLKTPVWMDRWQVTYDGMPETAINPAKGYYPPQDTVDEGQTIVFGVATENISGFDMDSLLVKYWLTDRNNNVVPLATRRLRPHPSADVLLDSIHLNTRGYPGLNSIWYEVNTTDTVTSQYDQPEQYHFNNYAQKTFYVRSDITNPLLDVTFDGVRILNGDIVSAKPLISVALKDENKFLALNDTAVYRLYIKNLQTGNEERVYFNNPSVIRFLPASLPKNSCKIEYTPAFADGKYQLRVQARDISDNESGDNDYVIQFEVINKSTITNLYNYPNPFSTSTRFVFTLTGSELPDDLRIQIITVTGKVVREISQTELGLLHIGNNVTEFAWDGTDTYGDRLANGVYFYRVIARMNGENIEHRETEADPMFHKGFGKMYLIR